MVKKFEEFKDVDHIRKKNAAITQDFESAIELADTIIDEDEDENWILVTRRKRRRPIKTQWSAQQQRNFKATGDILESPSSFKYSQFTGDDDTIQIQQQQQQPQQLVQPAQQQLFLQQPPLQPGQQQQPPQPQQPQPPQQLQPAQHQQPQQPPQQPAQPPQPQQQQRGLRDAQPVQQPQLISKGATANPAGPVQPGIGAKGLGQVRSEQQLQTHTKPQPDRGRTSFGADVTRVPTHHTKHSSSRETSPRFQPYDKTAFLKQQSGESQILSRLRSPVRDRPTEVLPGVQTTLPSPPVSVREKPSPTVRTDIPLHRQGWTGASGGSVPEENRPRIPDVQPDPGPHPEADTATTDPNTSSASGADPDVQVYQNVNPTAPGAPRVALPRKGATSTSSSSGGTGAIPKSRPVLKKTPPAKTDPKRVQFSFSTKPANPSHPQVKPSPPTARPQARPSPPSSRPQVKPSPPSVTTARQGVKRPPTPDLEIKIRPTKTLDILDEVLAGQPTRRVAGQLVPDTLIQIQEPAPTDKAKKAKKPVEPSDRVLRSTK